MALVVDVAPAAKGQRAGLAAFGVFLAARRFAAIAAFQTGFCTFHNAVCVKANEFFAS
jgi:hypothetical protein